MQASRVFNVDLARVDYKLETWRQAASPPIKAPSSIPLFFAASSSGISHPLRFSVYFRKIACKNWSTQGALSRIKEVNLLFERSTFISIFEWFRQG